MMDMDAKKLGVAAFIAMLTIMIALHAESASDAACIAATGIGFTIFIVGLFGILPLMAMGLIIAYPFNKDARKNLHDLGAPFALFFGFCPVACGVVLYLTGGC